MNINSQYPFWSYNRFCERQSDHRYISLLTVPASRHLIESTGSETFAIMLLKPAKSIFSLFLQVTSGTIAKSVADVSLIQEGMEVCNSPGQHY